MLRIVLRATLTVLFASGAASAQGPSPAGFEVGEPFPVVAFPSAVDGTPVSIADFRGHKVVLHIFASW